VICLKRLIKEEKQINILYHDISIEKNTTSSRLKSRNKELWEVSMSPISPLYPGYYTESQEDREKEKEDDIDD